MSFHNDGDGLSDEKKKDLKYLLSKDNTRLGIRGGWWCKPNLGVSFQLNSEPSLGRPIKGFLPPPLNSERIEYSLLDHCWGTHQTVRRC